MLYAATYNITCNLIPLRKTQQEPFTSQILMIQSTLPNLYSQCLSFPFIYPQKPSIQKTILISIYSPQRKIRNISCSARRRVRYEEEDEEEEEYGHNEEISMLEYYSESTRSVALLVRAVVKGEEEMVLIFRGFSSCLSSRTATDPSRSVLPANAAITYIDVVKGPFDPSNIEYLERDLTWETFKSRLQTKNM